MKRPLLCLFFFMGLGIVDLKAQMPRHGIMLGTDVPLYYSAGYEYRAAEHWFFGGKAGVLDFPFDVVLLEFMKSFDADDMLVNTIGDAFSYGVQMKPYVKRMFKCFYIGGAYSYLALVAKECPSEAIENYYGITIDDRRRSVPLTLTSTLHNIGVFTGYEVDLGNPSWALQLELSVLKTFASQSRIRRTSGDGLPRLSAAIDDELGSFFAKKGYLPSLNVTLCRKF
ncbi:MAG: hypothetical protein QM786_16635 [Breznakibacter sp.]